jgi:PAS domain S-box-containing protein
MKFPGGRERMEITKEILEHYEAFSPVDTAIYHVNGTALETLFLSSNIPALLDMTREEYLQITKKDAMDLTIPQDRAGLLKATLECVKNGTHLDYYYRVYHKTFGFDWVHVDAHVCGIMGEGAVILARFANLTKEGGIYQEILNQSERMILVIDRNTHEILFANRAAQSSRRLQGKSILNVTCHGFLRNQDEPCRECIICSGDPEGIKDHIEFDEKNRKWNRISGKMISWCGHEAMMMYVMDITDEKESEAETKRLNRIYQATTSAAKLLLWEYDIPNHRIILSDDAYTQGELRKTGYGRTVENVPESMLQHIEDRSVAVFCELFRKVEEGTDASGEIWFKRQPSIEAGCEQITYTVIRDESGRAVKAYGTGRNITAEKKEEDRYRREIEYLRENNDFDLIAKGHYNLTRNRVIEYSGPVQRVYKGTGEKTYDEILSAFLERKYTDEDRRILKEKMDRQYLIRKSQQGEMQADIRYEWFPDGTEPVWISENIHTYIMPDSGDVECFTYSYDITEKKQNDAILELVSQNEFDYIGLIYSRTGKFELKVRSRDVGFPKELHRKVNYSECLEYVRRNFLSQDEIKRYDEATEPGKILRGLETNRFYTVVYRRTENGKTFCKQLNYSWLDEASGIILAVRTDVTAAYEREQAQLNKVRAAKLEADRANEAKSSFLSGMSHDIRTPLNGIIGFTEIAIREKDPEKKQGYLEKIRMSGSLLNDLVNDTLELSRIESGKMILEPEITSTREILDTVITALRPSAELKGIGIVTERETIPSVPVWADRRKVQKIFLNLLSNAIKYTPSGGTVHLSAETLDVPENGCTQKFKIEDNGIGMSREFLERLYEPFAQEKRPEAKDVTGTGLGLAIVKDTVDLMGGKIEVRSRIGKGTCFTVGLPLPSAASSGIHDERADGKQISLSGKRVLLFEDNYLNSEIASILLKENGMEVDTAENGREGVEKFKNSADGYYDVILMDIRMPLMSGYEAARAIRAMDREDVRVVPIIPMSADAFEEDIRHAERSGMNGYITKPVDPEKMMRTIRSLIREHEMPDYLNRDPGIFKTVS